ncbi:hypothetical protein C1H46_007543 [Malus baccata]|uniref:Exocyst subunit Exo70 family protein n=1 Tax=Malus baccata TaxID=106549 RepID=A0A540N703_MALBA|nr:hypothetical protein C1H46_007543 [Malus baccata]
MTLFGFPESVGKSKKLSPKKMFRVLDLYQAVSDLWPEIESIFSFESTFTVRSLAVNSLLKLGEAFRSMLEEFESAIQKETSKTPVLVGGVDPPEPTHGSIESTRGTKSLSQSERVDGICD